MRLTAMQTGFYQGRMIQPGEEFEFNERWMNPPKWAAPAGTPLPPPKKPFHGKPELTLDEVEAAAGRIPAGVDADTKPLDAQLAVHRKMGTRPIDPVESTGFF